MLIYVRRCGMSANEITHHPSHYLQSKPMKVEVQSSTRSLGSHQTTSYALWLSLDQLSTTEQITWILTANRSSYELQLLLMKKIHYVLSRMKKCEKNSYVVFVKTGKEEEIQTKDNMIQTPNWQQNNA